MSLRDAIAESLLVVPDNFQISTPHRQFGSGSASIGTTPTAALATATLQDSMPFVADDGIYFERLLVVMTAATPVTLQGLSLGVSWTPNATNLVWPLGTPEITLVSFAGRNTVVFQPSLMLMRDLQAVFIDSGGVGAPFTLPQPLTVLLTLTAQATTAVTMSINLFINWRRLSQLQEY